MKTKIFLLLCLLLPLGLEAKPIRVVSFGANGTHWPELIPTPFMYDNTVSNVVEVACNWTAIRSAIQAVTANQANSGTLILVQPGELAGNGSSSGSDPVIESVGSAAWGQRVTVAPRDGYGSVKWKNGVRFLKVFGVCFAGFESIGISGVKMQGCRRSALAWIKCTGHLGVYGTSGLVTEGIEIVEVVQPDHYVVSDDSADVYAGGGNIEGWRFDGCYHAPRFFEYPYTGGKPHTDTLQFATASGGSYGSMTMRDSAYFSSNNCAIQTGNVDGLSLEHCYVTSGDVSLSRYPFLSGGATEGVNNAFNGSGSNMQAKDCTFIGGMAINTSDAARPWSFVQNTKTSKAYGSSNQPLSGSWTVDTGLNQNNSGMPPYPTSSYLAGIWDNPGATTQTSTPVFIPPGGSYGSPQSVAMTCSTAGATIYYSTNGTTPTTSSTRYTSPVSVSSSMTLKAIAVSSALTNSPVRTDNYVISNQVEAPVFSPGGGAYSTAQTVTISSSTAAATIHYTTDGTTPTTQSPVYTGALLIGANTSLKALAVKSGSANSTVSSASYSIGTSYTSQDAWTNVKLATLSGSFTIKWDSIPSASAIDGVTGLSLAAADSYADLACIVRFSTAGTIDVRNGGVYQAMNVMNYVGGTAYRFELVVDVAARQYSVTVTPDGGASVVLAQNYAFRTEQASVTTLDNLALVSLGGGSHTVSNLVIGTTAPPAKPSTPQGLRRVTPAQ